jgi:hypothetical protein
MSNGLRLRVLQPFGACRAAHAFPLFCCFGWAVGVFPFFVSTSAGDASRPAVACWGFGSPGQSHARGALRYLFHWLPVAISQFLVVSGAIAFWPCYVTLAVLWLRAGRIRYFSLLAGMSAPVFIYWHIASEAGMGVQTKTYVRHRA